MKTIRVRYLSVLEAQRGLAEEALQTEAQTPEQLFRDLIDAHKLTVPPRGLRAALNDDFVPLNTPLWEGDTVAFVAAP